MTDDKHASARVTVDAVILHYDSKRQMLRLLLIERSNPPYQNSWALPGGFLDEDDSTLTVATRRELLEETGMDIAPERFFTCGSFGDLGRDPRGRTVTGAYVALVTESEATSVKAGSDARSVSFFDLNDLPALAFDHGDIIHSALLHMVLRLGSRFEMDNLVPEALLRDLDDAVEVATQLLLGGFRSSI
jgi:8-oxo-dGTP diphosphatase